MWLWQLILFWVAMSSFPWVRFTGFSLACGSFNSRSLTCSYSLFVYLVVNFTCFILELTALELSWTSLLLNGFPGPCTCDTLMCISSFIIFGLYLHCASDGYRLYNYERFVFFGPRFCACWNWNWISIVTMPTEEQLYNVSQSLFSFNFSVLSAVLSLICHFYFGNYATSGGYLPLLLSPSTASPPTAFCFSLLPFP